MFLPKAFLKQSGCEMLNFLRIVSYDNRLKKHMNLILPGEGHIRVVEATFKGI